MLLLLFLHAVVGFLVIAFGSRLGRRAVAIAAVPLVATLVWLGTERAGILDGQVVTEHWRWVPGLDLSLDLRLDGFAALMVLLVSGIGVLVLAYSASYLPSRGEGTGRLIGLLVLFSGAMVGLVLADNVFFLVTCWELTSVTSYLLIGNDSESPRARAAALHALLVTGAGGLAMLVGFVLIGQVSGSYELSTIVASPPTGTTATVGLLLVLVGAMAKSAQYPLSSWLPGAMVAPTPVSAYLHSATMVNAGIYLVARLAPAVAPITPVWRPTVAAVGLVTMVLGGLRALRRHDLKLLLAFSTVSQLGFLFVLYGVGTPAATAAGSALLLAHAVFKAALFMVVGIVEHETGTRDLRALRGLGRAWVPVTVIAVISVASMAGIPMAFGFVAKEADFEAFAHGGLAWSGVILGVLVVGSMLTVAYSIRFVWGAFTAGANDWVGAPEPAPVPHVPSAAFVAPPAVLAAVTLVLGIFPSLADDLLSAATAALQPDAPPVHLALWHGVNLALVLSGVALAGGITLFVARRPVARVLAWGRRIPSGADAYRATLRGTNAVADRLTRVVQNGSLPTYVGVILLTASLMPLIALAGGPWPSWPDLLDTPAHLVVVAVLVGGGLGAALVRRRLTAIVCLSVVGYAMAGLFVVEGAPDLALTQVTVETLSTVVFVLVLRRLPDRFTEPSRRGRPFRLAIAAAVGVAVFVFALVAAGSRTAPPVAQEMVERSLPDGGGRNVVNVILVDFRGLDTLGEITVLAVAGVGAVALARAGRRRPDPSTTPAAPASTEEGA